MTSQIGEKTVKQVASQVAAKKSDSRKIAKRHQRMSNSQKDSQIANLIAKTVKQPKESFIAKKAIKKPKRQSNSEKDSQIAERKSNS